MLLPNREQTVEFLSESEHVNYSSHCDVPINHLMLPAHGHDYYRHGYATDTRSHEDAKEEVDKKDVDYHRHSSPPPSVMARQSALCKRGRDSDPINAYANTDTARPTWSVNTGISVGKSKTYKKASEHYTRDAVILLLDMMEKAAYGCRKKSKKSLNQVFDAGIELAKTQHDVERSADGWVKSTSD